MTRGEIPLSGGRVTPGVTRVDNTVRRPLFKNSGFVHSMLQHLERIGFNGAPLFLGIADNSKEILSYLEGTVPSDLAWYSDSQLEAAAKLIRRYHDATTKFAEQNRGEVICHNDLSPCNFVFTGDQPYAIIDFDAAAPGSRISDLGYAAWMWLDIGNQDNLPEEQRRRLQLFCQAYGQSFDQSVVKAMLQRQTLLMETSDKQAHSAASVWAKSCYAWTNEYLTDGRK
jgi:thiamine kinase-like enzyme